MNSIQVNSFRIKAPFCSHQRPHHFRCWYSLISASAANSYRGCVWPSRWWPPARDLQGHTRWWACAGPCLAAEGRAWRTASLARPPGDATRWCWRNLKRTGNKNKHNAWNQHSHRRRTSRAWSADLNEHRWELWGFYWRLLEPHTNALVDFTFTVSGSDNSCSAQLKIS